MPKQGTKTTKETERKTKKTEELGAIAYDQYKILLEDKFFYLKVRFLKHIIGKINSCNKEFQTRHLSIHKLKSQTKLCYNNIAELIIKPDYHQHNPSNILGQDLDTEGVQKKLLMDAKEFEMTVFNCFTDVMHEDLDETQRKDLYETFQPFLVSLLVYLGKYLPLQDKLVGVLDFVQLRGSTGEIKDKMVQFNNKFKIIKPEELQHEFGNLMADGIEKYRKEDDAVLSMWNAIEKAGYRKLAMLANAAQTLPSGSSDIENTFSETKLFKTLLRNQLSDQSLEALLLIDQEFKIHNRFHVSDGLLALYENNFSKKKKAPGETLKNRLELLEFLPNL